MEKLTATDASFLYSETRHCNSNIGSLNILELPAEQSAGAFVESLKTYMSDRLHLVSYLSRKLAFVPGNWDHPAWVEDDNVNMDNHIINFPVESPGKLADIERAVALIHEIKMSMDRPLWAMWVLTGLEGNRVAYYNQVHHAAIDGASGNAAYTVLMDETPDHPAPAEPAPSGPLSEQVSPLQLLEDSMKNFLRFQMESGERFTGSIDSSRRLMGRALAGGDFGAFGKVAPATPFNTQISNTRSWAAGEMPLADVKQMGKKVDATINDVVMAICAQGLRTYLARSGNLPEDNLIAGCPVSLRKPGDTKPGTQVTMMNVELGTSIPDPIERLKAIHASAETAKEITADLASAFEGNAAMPGLPAMMQAGLTLSEDLGLARYFRGPVNVVISNVPGPRTTLYSNGAKMISHYPISIPAHGIGLNITVQSYCKQLFLGITACGEAVPDADLLRDDLINAFQDLRAELLPTNVSELNVPPVPVRAPLHVSSQDPQHEKVA